MSEKNTEYYELKIKINPEMEDIISDICFENLPCEGVVLAEETYKDLELVSTTEGTLRVFLNPCLNNAGQILLSGKFDGTAECTRAYVKKLLDDRRKLLKLRGFNDNELGSWEFSFEVKQNEDWSKIWKEKWDITHVSDKITVVPDWLEYAPCREDEVVIRMEPGCAFGTGTHKTTQLCMKVIEKYLNPGDEVADIGTGSGILAICALKFGAKFVYGCDNDETVIDVANKNALKNGIKVLNTPSLTTDNGVFFELNTADNVHKTFDFVTANILHNVLAEIMGDLKAIMKPDAYLVLSGILDDKKNVVLKAIARENLQITEELHNEQWTAFVVKKLKRGKD